MNKVEISGGVMEWDANDGTIRYRDDQGNTEGVWRPGEDDYDTHKRQYFPHHITFQQLKKGTEVVWRGQKGKVVAKIEDYADGVEGYVKVAIGNNVYILNETMVNYTDRLTLPNG
jgi:hypothetical protein